MREDKWIEKKVIDGTEVFKIIYLVDQQISNIKVVAKIEEGLILLNDASGLTGIQEFVNEMDEVHMVDKQDEMMIKNYLGNHKVKTRESFKNLMSAIELGGEDVEFVENGGDYFAVVKSSSEDELAVAYTIISNADGKIVTYGEIQNDNQLFRLFDMRAQRMEELNLVSDSILITGDTYAIFEKIGSEIAITTVVASMDGEDIRLEAKSQSAAMWKNNKQGGQLEAVPGVEDVMRPVFERAIDKVKRYMSELS